MTYGILVALLLVYAGFVIVDLFGDGREGWITSVRETPKRNYPRFGKAVYGIYAITFILAALVGYVGMFFLWDLSPVLFAFGVVCKNLDFSLPSTTSVFRNGIVNLETFYEGFLIAILFFGPARSLFDTT